MPEWMHNRAEHILAKNPSMPKSEAFAIATQQMHSLGKGPKGYGTEEGRAKAKAKFNTPKDDVKAANPGGLESSKMKTSGSLEDMELRIALEDRAKHLKEKRPGHYATPAQIKADIYMNSKMEKKALEMLLLEDHENEFKLKKPMHMGNGLMMVPKGYFSKMDKEMKPTSKMAYACLDELQKIAAEKDSGC